MGESEQGRLVAIVAAVRDLRNMGAVHVRLHDVGVSLEVSFLPSETLIAPPGETVEERLVREKREYENTLFHSSSGDAP